MKTSLQYSLPYIRYRILTVFVTVFVTILDTIFVTMFVQSSFQVRSRFVHEWITIFNLQGSLQNHYKIVQEFSRKHKHKITRTKYNTIEIAVQHISCRLTPKRQRGVHKPYTHEETRQTLTQSLHSMSTIETQPHKRGAFIIRSQLLIGSFEPLVFARNISRKKQIDQNVHIVSHAVQMRQG